MYATQVTGRIEPGREAEARQTLEGRILGEVKGAPGFVAGYWFEPVANQGASDVLWETKEHADAAAAGLREGSRPAAPVTVEHIEVREVIYSI